MEKFGLTNLIIGPLFTIIGWLWFRYPPKKINFLYGYRTPQSMKSQAHWTEANRYAARFGIVLGFTTSALQVISYLMVGALTALKVGAGALLVGIVLMVIATERRLIKLFGS
jgi:uncharacterized membrane protein